MHTQDYAAAKKTLEPLLAAGVEPKLKESAELTMKSIENRTRKPRVEQPPPELKQNSASPKVIPEAKQNTDPEKSASEPLSNKGKLEFLSQYPTFAGSVRFGPVNKTAFIYFKPMAGQTKLAGDAVAIEFTKD